MHDLTMRSVEIIAHLICNQFSLKSNTVFFVMNIKMIVEQIGSERHIFVVTLMVRTVNIASNCV